MSESAEPRALNCPNCGAPLDFPRGQSTVRCRFCDSTIERSVEAPTDDDDAHVIRIDTNSIPGGGSGPARKFVLKMRNGEPVVIEVSDQPDRPATRPSEPQHLNPNWAREANRFNEAERARRAAVARASQSRRPMATPKPAQSSARGCLITVAIVLVVACAIVGIFYVNSPQAGLMVQQFMAGNFDQALATSGTLGANLLLSDMAVYVPGEGDDDAQALLMSIQYPMNDGARQNRLIGVNLVTRKLLWQSEPLDPDLYDTIIRYDADRVYLISGDDLVAIDRTDGATVWTQRLADVLSFGICPGCLQLLDGRLAVLSDDGTLQAYDAATGDALWSIVADEASPRGLYVLNGRFAFMDRNADIQGVLRTFDPASGDEQAVIPRCEIGDDQTGYADWTTPLLVAPDGASFYLIMNSYATCLQRWDARTLKPVWTTAVPDELANSVAVGDGMPALLTAERLYLAANNHVLAVSTSSGDIRALVTDDDNEFTLVAAHGDDLVVRAQRSRGSTRYSLWDVDAGNGDTRWTYDLDDAPPLDLGGIVDENDPMWLAQPSDAGLRLIWFQANEDDVNHAILNETLAWETGETSGQVKTVLGLPTIIFSAPNWIYWQDDDTFWMVDENDLLHFDVANNKVLSRWP